MRDSSINLIRALGDILQVANNAPTLIAHMKKRESSS
ncbi:Putative uncharacterized protein [Bacillus wiedmannii]|nr:Putative uncharacterized protein [Bacillus wiedmannii]